MTCCHCAAKAARGPCRQPASSFVAAFPEQGQISYLAGTVWVDLSRERAAPNLLKTEIIVMLGGLIRSARTGRLFSDKMRLTNIPADLSSEPDALYVSTETLEQGRVILSDGDDEPEVEGTPEMVLEIVSPPSALKDTEILRHQCWKAGIEEYWLIDMTVEPLDFQLLHRGSKSYTPARRKDGWMKSVVFGQSFRWLRERDERDLSWFTLEMR